MTFDNDSGRTHWATCWRDPEHHACAVAMVERLVLAVDLALVELRPLGRTPLGSVDRLISIVRSMRKQNTEPAVPEPPK